MKESSQQEVNGSVLLVNGLSGMRITSYHQNQLLTDEFKVKNRERIRIYLIIQRVAINHIAT